MKVNLHIVEHLEATLNEDTTLAIASYSFGGRKCRSSILPLLGRCTI
jgi:hypothetical protein